MRARNILVAGLVDAFDAENAGNLADINEDGLELALVGNFEVGVNTRVGAIGTAFEVMDVGTGAADDRGDFGEKPGAVARADGELDGKLGFGSAAPFDGDAAFGLVHEILDVGTRSSVDGDTAPAGDVADNFVARNGIATLGAVNEQIVVALDHQGRRAKTQHAFDGLDESGLGIDSLGLRGFFRFSKNAREDLTGRIFSETDGGVEILNFGETAIVNEFEDVRLGNFLEAAAKMAGFVFEQALAHFRSLFALLLVDPVADLTLRRGRPNKTEPVAAGVVALLRKNLNHIATGDLDRKRHHLAVHLCADARSEEH